LRGSPSYLGGAGRGGFGPNDRAVSRWGPGRPGECALARQLRRSLFFVVRARERRHESHEIVDISLSQGERLDVFVEIRILQAGAFVVVVDHIPKRLLRTIVKVRPSHQHVAYVRCLEGGSVLLLLGDEKAAQRWHVGLDRGAIDCRRISGLDELLGLARQRDDFVLDSEGADVVKVVIYKIGDVPLRIGQRMTFVAARLVVEELLATLGRSVNRVLVAGDKVIERRIKR